MMIHPLASSLAGAALPHATSNGSPTASESSGAGRPSHQSPVEPEQADLQLIANLKARDREVRAHEAAHQSVGGVHAGAASYTYQRGPDGVAYAVGGEVPIDLSAVAGNPLATIEKMRTVRAAALAPAQPSGQDRAVAAEAGQVLLQAQSELAQLAKNELEEPDKRPGQAVADAYRKVSDLPAEPAAEGLGGFQATV